MNPCYHRRTAAIAAIALTVTLILGCGSNNTYAPEAKGNNAPDFTLTTTSNTVSVTSSSSTPAQYNLVLTSQNGFSSPVTLTVSGVPNELGSNFSTSPVTPTSGGAATTFSISPGEGWGALGSYPITVTATGGGVTHTLALTFNIGATPAFTVSAAPASGLIAPGDTSTHTVTVKSVAGFTGAVTLSASGLPAGVTANFNPPTVTPTEAGATSQLAIVTTGGAWLEVISRSRPAQLVTPAGDHMIYINGVSGTMNRSAAVTLHVTGLNLTVSPKTQDLNNAGSAIYTITVTPVNGFTGTAHYFVSGLPYGMGWEFSPSALNFTDANPQTVVLSVTNGENMTAGNFLFTVECAGQGRMMCSDNATVKVRFEPY